MQTGIHYALTNGGTNLAIIDVTHPAFAVTATEAELAVMSEQYVLESSKRPEPTPALRAALQRSTFGRAMIAASDTFLDGMNTYLLKLGPDHLGDDADPLDRLIAGSFPAFAVRLRLQDMAQLLAGALSNAAAGNPKRQVCLINVGGGPASDSWNSLICLHTQQPDLLTGRKIVVAVMDIDSLGPAFGARAIDRLRTPGAPLAGLDISLRHFTYEWSQVEILRETLNHLNAADAVCAVSSEGGLFEYGSDTEIVANLKTLYAGTSSDSIIVGSVTRDGEVMRASQIASRIPIRPRTIEAFQVLAGEAGWIVQHSIERPFSYNLSLSKA